MNNTNPTISNLHHPPPPRQLPISEKHEQNILSFVQASAPKTKIPGNPDTIR